MTIPNDVLIPFTDLIGESSLKFSITDLSLQSSYFVATVAILDDFSAYSGVTLYVKITANQLADLVKNSLQKIPLSAELFEDAVIVICIVLRSHPVSTIPAPIIEKTPREIGRKHLDNLKALMAEVNHG